MHATSRALGLLTLLALCACPQAGMGGASSASSSAGAVGSTGASTVASTSAGSSGGTSGPASSAGSSSGATSGGASSGAGTTGGSSSGTSGAATSSGASSGSTGATCPENGGSTPSLTCSLAAASHWAVAGEAIELDCALGAGEAPVRWEVQVAPGPAVVDDRSLGTAHKLWVTYRASDLPALFADGTSTVTVTAHFCDAAPAQAQASYPVLGNTLVVDASTGVLSFASDGTQAGAFLGPAAVQSASMVYRLPSGNFLVGCKAGTCAKPLQVFDPQGNHLSDFDTTDHGGNAVWPTDVRPWGAAVDNQGNVWVSGFKGQDEAGALNVFDANGIFVGAAPQPADPSQAIAWWVPLGVAKLSDGTIAVGMGGTLGGEPYLALYQGLAQVSLVHLGWEDCKDSGGATPNCTTSQYGNGSASGLLTRNGELFVSTTYETPANLLAYGDPGLSLRRAAVKPTNSVDNWGNAWLGQVAPFGDQLLVGAMLSYDCISIVDSTTLYAPAGWPANKNGCWLYASSMNITGLYHLTAP